LGDWYQLGLQVSAAYPGSVLVVIRQPVLVRVTSTGGMFFSSTETNTIRTPTSPFKTPCAEVVGSP
jgi:hypothetical protein